VHATYDQCVINFLEQAGGKPDWIKLADLNITGNGHFMHVENNNRQIAKVIEDWIQEKESM